MTTLSGLTISGGNSQTNGGGVLVEYDSTLTITNSAISDNTTLGGGGGIFNEGALTVSGTTIEDNSGGGYGGGIDNYGLGTLAVTGGTTIEDNTASDDGGGGIGSYGTLTVSDGSTIANNVGGGISGYGPGPTTIVDSTIEDNAMTGNGCCTYGGGIGADGTLTITDSTIEGNTASDGGGGGVAVLGTATITGSTIDGNTSTNYSSGGGIYNQGTLTLADSTIQGNSAPIDIGGGIVNDGVATVTGTTIADNSASLGGGIFNNGALSVTDSTITGNSTATFANGGGIANAGTLTAVNTTIAYNDAGFNYYNDESGIGGGGGVYDYSGATTTLYNTIVAANTADDGPDDIAGAGICSASAYNLVGVDETGSLSNGTSGNLVIGTANPGLGLLAYNGGPTQTIALFAGSPAIDAGSVALANEYSLTTDQRGPGYPRIVNGSVDIGAYERAAPTSTTLVSSANPSVYGQTITLTTTVTAGGAPTVYTVNSTGSGSSGTGTSGDSSLRHRPGRHEPELGRQRDRVCPDSLQRVQPADDHSDRHAGAGRAIRAAGDRRPRRGRGHDQRRWCRPGLSRRARRGDDPFGPDHLGGKQPDQRRRRPCGIRQHADDHQQRHLGQYDPRRRRRHIQQRRADGQRHHNRGQLRGGLRRRHRQLRPWHLDGHRRHHDRGQHGK